MRLTPEYEPVSRIYLSFVRQFFNINTMPNYANGILLNQAALVPAYGRREDRVIVDIVRGLGFDVFPIDCSEVILSNAAVHCLSKTLPRCVTPLA